MTQRAQLVLRSAILPFLVVSMVVMCHAQDTPRQIPIATFADRYSIVFPALQQYVHDYLYDRLYRGRLAEGYEKALDDMLVNQLKRIDFFARGLDGSAGMLKLLRRSINEELAIRYYKAYYHAKYVNDAAVRQAYTEMGREVSFHQVVLAIPQNASQDQIDSLRALAYEIKGKVRRGDDIAALRKQYARTSGSRAGNDLQSVNWKMSLSDEVSGSIFHLPANAVEVVPGSESFSVVKIVSITTRNVPPYHQVEAEIRTALDEHFTPRSYAEFEQAKKGLLDTNRVTWNNKAITQLLRWSNIPEFYRSAFLDTVTSLYVDTLSRAIARGRNFVILKHPKGQVDLKEYLRLLNDVLIPGKYASIDEENLKNFILEAVRTSMIVEKAVKLGLQKDVFNAQTTNPVLKEGIVRLYNRLVVDRQIPAATEPSLKQFYQANRDSLYYQLAKINLYVIVDRHKTVLEGMKAKLHQNVPFEKLAPRILVKTYIRRRDGTLATYLGIEPPFFAEAGFKLKLNEVAGPIEYVDPEKGKQFALIKCVGVREEKQLSYEEAKRTIADDFTNYHRERVSRRQQEQLKKQYNAMIHKDVLKEKLASIGIDAAK